MSVNCGEDVIRLTPKLYTTIPIKVKETNAEIAINKIEFFILGSLKKIKYSIDIKMKIMNTQIKL